MRAAKVFIIAALFLLAAWPKLAADELRWAFDFEKSKPAAWWPSRGVSVKRLRDPAAGGKFCARVVFNASEAPAWIIGEGLNEAGLPHDWRAFAFLELGIRNLQSSPERLIIQIKDAGGRLYKEDVILQPQESQTIRIRLDEISAFIDLASIRHLNFFRWHPSGKAAFYVDNIRLLPRTFQPGQPAAAPIAEASGQWRLSWASSAEKILRKPSSFNGSRTFPIRLALAAGETEAVQLVVEGGPWPVHVTATAGIFSNAKGQSLAAESIRIRAVGYVKTQKPYYPVTFIGDWPDPLLPSSVVAVPPGELQPIWIDAKIPPTTSAGDYTGVITLADDRGRAEQVSLIIHVWGFALSKTTHLKTAFDFYPERLKRVYEEVIPGGSLWKGRMRQLQQRFFEDMLDHRLMPMMHVNPSDESAMAELIRYRQAGLSFFSVGSRGGAFDNNWPGDEKQLQQLMQSYSEDARKLKEQGLLKEAYAYLYDEPKLDEARVSQAAAALGKAAPGLKRLVTFYDPPNPQINAQWLKDVDILCLRISGFNPDLAARWVLQAKEIWLYTSSPSHPYPSLVIESPALSARLLAWMCWKYQIKGLLYWCVNFWEANPWENPATFRPDQNGNGFLYYPGINGPVDSIRLEVLRDGLEDYEYLYRLNQLAEEARAAGNPDPALLFHARQLLSVDPRLVSSLREYAKDPDILMENRRDIAETIEALQQLLKLPEETEK